MYLKAALYLSSGEYFHILKIFAENEKFDRIPDNEKWDEKISEKSSFFWGNIDVLYQKWWFWTKMMG